MATALTSHRGVNLLLPGQVIRYKQSFFLGDRFELPSGSRVGLGGLRGFKLQLAPPGATPVPVEEAVVAKRKRGERGVTVRPAPTPCPSSRLSVGA